MKMKEKHNVWILQLIELWRAAEQHCRLHVPPQNPDHGHIQQLKPGKTPIEKRKEKRYFYKVYTLTTTTPQN